VSRGLVKARFIVSICASGALFVSLAQLANGQTIVGPNDVPYAERDPASVDQNPFRADWAALENEIFFGSAKGLFGLSPLPTTRRSFLLPGGTKNSTSSTNAAVAHTWPNDHFIFFTFVSGVRSMTIRTAPDAPPPASDTFTWNSSGTDFNTAASWSNTGNLSNGVPGFTQIADFSVFLNVQPNLSATVAVRGVTFGVGADGFILTSSNSAQLAVGVDGIQASNITGTNTITAPLVLNMNESINQAAGGTLNITGPVVLGGDPGITLTIGSPSGNGTINFTPSTVELAGDLTLVTNVDVTLPAITLLPAPPFTAALTKNGNGTLTLTGGSSYNGQTTVNGGTLRVMNSSGSATGTGAVVVNNSGTLSGTGSIDSGTNTITINGALSPGADAAAGNPGTINLASSAGAGALTLSSSSNLLFDITNTSTKDLIALTATQVSLGGGTLTLNLAGGFDYTQQYTIISGVSGLIGSFGSVTGYDSANWAAVFTLNDTDYNLTFTPIPEPSTWIGAALPLAAIWFAARRRLRLSGAKS